MAARYEQRHERQRRGRLFQHRRKQVSLQVMNTDNRQAGSKSEAPGHRGRNHERTNKARPLCIGDAIELLERNPGFPEDLSDHGQQFPDMVPGRELGYDAAEVSVNSELAVDLVRQETTSVVEHGDAGFVAGSFDAEDTHGLRLQALGARLQACGQDCPASYTVHRSLFTVHSGYGFAFGPMGR